MPKKLSVYTCTCICILLFAQSCATKTVQQQSLIGISESALVAMDKETLRKLSIKLYTDIINEARQKNILNTQPKLTQKVRRIGIKIIQQLEDIDSSQWQWQINVVDQFSLNAWVLPGGNIVFHRGFIERLSLTDDEIAIVLAHEIAHAVLEHTRNQFAYAGISTQQMSYFPNDSKEKFDFKAIEQIQTQELAADTLGNELAAKAGYNPYAAVQLWKKLFKLSQRQRNEFIGQNDFIIQRVQHTMQLAAKNYPLYLAAK